MATPSSLTPEQARLETLNKQYQEASKRADNAVRKQYESISKIREAQAPSSSRREKAFRRASVGAEGALDIKLNSQDAKNIADTISESFSLIDPSAVTTKQLGAIQNQITQMLSLAKALPDSEDSAKLYKALENIQGELNSFKTNSSIFGTGGLGRAAARAGLATAQVGAGGVLGLVSAATGGNRLAEGAAGLALNAFGGIAGGIGSMFRRNRTAAQIDEKTKLLQAKMEEASARNEARNLDIQAYGKPQAGVAAQSLGPISSGPSIATVAGAVGGPSGIATLISISGMQLSEFRKWVKDEKAMADFDKSFKTEVLEDLEGIMHALDAQPIKKKAVQGEKSATKSIFGELADVFMGGASGKGLIGLLTEFASVAASVVAVLGVGWLGKKLGDAASGAISDKPWFTNTVDALGNAATGRRGGTNFAGKANNAYEAINMAAKRVGVGPGVLYGYLKEENPQMDPNAVNKSGATGLFQILPSTQKLLRQKYGKDYPELNGDFTDPYTNAVGAALLRKEQIGMGALSGAQGYAVHQGGPAAYKALRDANPNAIAAQVADSVVPGDSAANRHLFYSKTGVPYTVGEYWKNLRRVDVNAQKYDSGQIAPLEQSLAANKIAAMKMQVQRTDAAIAAARGASGGPSVVPVPTGGGSSGSPTVVVNTGNGESTYENLAKSNLVLGVH